MHNNIKTLNNIRQYSKKNHNFVLWSKTDLDHYTKGENKLNNP